MCGSERRRGKDKLVWMGVKYYSVKEGQPLLILFYLFFILFAIVFIPIVMIMQSGIKGVPGNNQKDQHILPTPNIQALNSVPQVINPSKNGIHVSDDTTRTTIKNIIKVLISLILNHNQING